MRSRATKGSCGRPLLGYSQRHGDRSCQSVVSRPPSGVVPGRDGARARPVLVRLRIHVPRRLVGLAVFAGAGLPDSYPMGMIRWLVADWKGRRALGLASIAEDAGRDAEAERYLRLSNRIFRLLRDGGNPWRDGPLSAAAKRGNKERPV